MSTVELVHITVRVPSPHAAEGATLLDDPEQLVIHVVAPRGSAEDEAADAEAAAE